MIRRLGVATLAIIALLLSLAGPAAAAAPSAITGPVQTVGATTATLRGTVNPGSQATTWYFEYGTSTSYGQKTASSSAGSGSANLDVASSLAGLSNGTTYHYRLVAENAAGTSRGSDGVFTTDRPPAVTTGGASGIGTTTATVAGTVDPNGLSSSWYVEYGTTTSYGSKTATKDAGNGTSAVGVSAALSGLDRGDDVPLPRRRHERRRLRPRCRSHVRHRRASSKPDVKLPSASNIGSTSARLNGSVNPNGRSTTWYFEYGASATSARARPIAAPVAAARTGPSTTT